MATQKSITLSKDEIKQAIAMAALAKAGIAPDTAGMTAVVKLTEEIDVLAGRSCQASVTITVPGT